MSVLTDIAGPGGDADRFHRVRKGARFAGLYGAGAWMAVQAADVCFPLLGLGGEAIALLAQAALGGLPAALLAGLVWPATRPAGAAGGDTEGARAEYRTGEKELAMSRRLLEREDALARLAGALEEASKGRGRVALVHGEAGIGKTALVDAFCRRQRGLRVLRGACDALFTPRPLGPLREIAGELGGELLSVVESGRRDAIFDAALAALAGRGHPVLCVIEDLHWADEATLDFVKFVGRRLHDAPLLLVLTYRDDEFGSGNPLSRVIGELPVSAVARVPLDPLSEHAVGELAGGSGRDPGGLHRLTGGNPFFVTEVLGNTSDQAPLSVRDAVLARAARLGPEARDLLDLASVVPGAMEVWLLHAIAGAHPEGLAETLDRGMLEHRYGAYAFRHELARRAVEAALPAGRRQVLNARVLRALEERDAERYAGRIVHHAAAAALGDTVLRYAPAAAADASRVGAHREAAAYYGHALAYADALPLARHAELCERRAFECYLIDELTLAHELRASALALWRRLEVPVRVGDNLRWLSRLSWALGRHTDARSYGRDALETLEGLPPGRELGFALSNMAQLHMLADEDEACREYGTRALALARELGDAEIEVHALNNLGTSGWRAGSDEGGGLLKRSLALAVEHEFHEHAARAYTNITFHLTEERAFAEAERWYDEGIRYCEERDLDFWGLYMGAWRARCRMDRGRWDEAGRMVDTILAQPGLAPVTRISALTVLAHLRNRTGSGRTRSILDEAWALAVESGDLMRTAPVAVARAEAAWIDGDGDAAAAVLEPLLPRLLAWTRHGLRAEALHWAWRAGLEVGLPRGLPEPWRLQMEGRHAEAARRWAELGCPYERALALVDAGEEAEALSILETLGAKAVARPLRARLRRGGRRPARSGGLTPRQSEVLAALGEGLTNAGIAEKLFISPKTVDHHLQAVFGYLGVSSRTEALTEARRRGLLDDPAR